MRRVNQALYLLTTGAREAAFRNIKTIAECLADELINAAKGSSNRWAPARHPTCAPAEGAPNTQVHQLKEVKRGICSVPTSPAEHCSVCAFVTILCRPQCSTVP
jgi:Ribosomal protein S7p/S5e